MPMSIDASDPWRDWLLAKHTRWWTGTTSTFYYSFIFLDSIASQCNFRWKLRKHLSWWRSRFHSIWYSSFTFKMKILMWRIFVGHFTLGLFFPNMAYKASGAQIVRHMLKTQGMLSGCAKAFRDGGILYSCSLFGKQNPPRQIAPFCSLIMSILF
ncbi:hypothetical protein KP509_07G024800 [Ceratopteris richardii]|uniref:Uncharacterized protein n=1 Tax=Ceratopteris richardii TaxID=49495 RepID=A0A8T2UD94_CERRI|nr:hypothetical protein KP509_07G024800 [Ceratopteris richardii]